MKTLEEIEKQYNLDYDKLIRLLYEVGTLTNISVENIVTKLDEIESINY